MSLDEIIIDIKDSCVEQILSSGKWSIEEAIEIGGLVLGMDTVNELFNNYKESTK